MTSRPRSRAARASVLPPADDAVTDPVTPVALADEQQADDELSALSLALPDGAVFSLWRLVDGAEKEWLESDVAVSDFSLRSISARHGAGRYIIYLAKPDPDAAGRWIRQGSKKFRIGGTALAGVGPNPPAMPGGSVADVGFARQYGDLIQSTTKAALDNQQLMQQMQLALLKSLTDRAPDPNADLMKAIMLKLLDRAQQGPTIADTIALADRMAQRTGPGAQLKETMELMRAARELGGEQDKPGWMPIAEKAIGLLERAQQYVPRQLAPGDAPAPDAPAVEVSTVTDATHPLLQFLAPMVPSLLLHAQNDRDPDTYAGVICDQIGDEHAADVLAFLQSPTFAQQLLAAFPGIAPHAHWFTELTDQVIDRLQERLTPAIEPPTPE